jgi:glycerol uptake facilitator-like aquaporin
MAVLPFIAAQIVGALSATYLCRWLFAGEKL